MNYCAQKNDFPYKGNLSLLGCQILIRCKYKQCFQEIMEMFSPVATTTWGTSDVVIDCNWKAAGRYLFRTRPADSKPLNGVRVHTKGKIATDDWSYLDPPIPPFVIDPFRERFVAFHAGSVQTPDGKCIIVLGNRGSGKTTTTLALVNSYQCSLLTDETVFLHKRTRLIEPFPRSVHLRDTDNNSLKKIGVAADKACKLVAHQASLATHMIFLKPNEEVQAGELLKLSSAETMENLLQHHLYAGCSPDESMVTLTQLARELSSFAYRYHTFKDLLLLPQKILENCGSMSVL